MKPSRKKSSAIAAARWISYAAAGAVTAIGAANDAEAGILFSGVLNTSMPSGGGIKNLSIKTLIANSDMGVKNVGRFTHVQGGSSFGGPATHYKLDFRGSDGSGDKPRGTSHSGIHYVSKLASGARISSGNFLPTKGAPSMGYWKGATEVGNRKWSAAGTGFIGFEFNLGSGSEHYGWAKVIDDGPKSYEMTLVEYAYGTVGQAITAGETGVAVPEPASLALLACGAAGLLAVRRGWSRKTHAAIV